MFGWLKRKQLNEQTKLLFQNSMAAEVEQAYYERKGDTATVERLKEFAEETKRITKAIHDVNRTTPEATTGELDRLLYINRELRRIFDEQPRLLVSETFDNTYKPAMGWDNYRKLMKQKP